MPRSCSRYDLGHSRQVHLPCSPRTRALILRDLAMLFGSRKFQAAVVMGPGLCGDEGEKEWIRNRTVLIRACNGGIALFFFLNVAPPPKSTPLPHPPPLPT